MSNVIQVVTIGLIVCSGGGMNVALAEGVSAIPISDLHRPTLSPDRVILTWTKDPKTSQAVTWRTSPAVTKGIAQIAESTPNKDFVKTSKEVIATTQPLKSKLFESHYHSAEFDGLKPATKYLFRVGDGTNWTEWSQFVTASDQPEPFSFVYFGDAQNDIKEHWSRVIRESFTDAPKARFFLHAGDLINNASADDEWGDWHRAGGWANMMIPSVATPGNHEYEVRTNPAPPKYSLTPFWRAQFALPTNGPAGLEETAYWMDYQGARIISLNSNENVTEQVPWLEGILADNPNKWTIVTFHHPIYSAAPKRDNPIIRKNWQPIFDRFHVDLVLQGHDHTYARTGMVMGQNVAEGTTTQSGKSGTVYVVSVSGPKMYDLARNDRMVRAASNTQLYQIITVDGGELRYRAHLATGELYDAFMLKKNDKGPNELIEQVPATPERLD
ncbi:metallophosphoesterase family protein [bacterium]|nr:metallophosphoesterase family protein [bacterium]